MEEKKKEVRLVLDNSIKYKLIVKKQLEDKIRYLCAKFPNNEYSGALFYRVNGDFNNNLVVECVDFCLCDIGSSTYTEFETRPEVVTYMCDNDLIGCYIGLMHSHDKMSTFFSGTDTNTLKEEGASMPHFVSLIVNNKGEYTAAITSRVTRYFTGVVQESMDTFGGNVIPHDTVPKEFSDTCIKYNFFDITVERDPWYAEIDSKVASIEEAKDKAKKDKFKYPISDYSFPSFSYTDDSKNKPLQLSMFDTDDIDEQLVDASDEEVCEEVLKKAFFLDAKKDVTKNTVLESIHHYISEKKKTGRTAVKNKFKRAIIASIEAVCGKKIDSVECLNLCNDISDYIDGFTYSIKDSVLSEKIEDALTNAFDTIVDIMEC